MTESLTYSHTLSQEEERVIYVNYWRLDLAAGVIIHRYSGEQKRLGEYQLKLLDVLIQHAGKTLSREELTQLVWERRVIGNNSLPNAIHALRVALEDDGKQQRIIKTVPKIGYILDADYCEQVDLEKTENPSETKTAEETEENITHASSFSPHDAYQHQQSHYQAQSQQEAERLEEITHPETYQPKNDPLPPATLAPEFAAKPKPVSVVTKFRKGFKRHIAGILIIFAVWAGFYYFAYYSRCHHFQAQELHKNVYSNINLYQFHNDEDPASDDANLYDRLKEPLYQLNQKLQSLNTRMLMYYNTTEIALNYTIVLKSECDEKQLAITIYHWRLNAERLNKMIHSETERRLNEMATCQS